MRQDWGGERGYVVKADPWREHTVAVRTPTVCRTFRLTSAAGPAGADSQPHRDEVDFTVWLDDDQETGLFRVQTERVVSTGPPRTVRYAVRNADGAVLCRVSRTAGRFWAPRRAEWTIELGDTPPVTAKKGSLQRWVLWWLYAPVNLLLFPVAAFSGADFLYAPTPCEAQWKAEDEPVLYFQGRNDLLFLERDGIDLRAAAGIALLYTRLKGL